MTQKTTQRADQGEGLSEAVEANPDDLQAYVNSRLGNLPASGVPEEPAWFVTGFDASWPQVLARADAEN